MSLADDFDIEDFRANFPEFAVGSPYTYTDAMITFWLSVADKMMNANRWQDLIIQGASLFIAHNLALQMMSIQNVIAGGTPGQGVDNVSSQSVGGALVSFDTSSSAVEGGGDYNQTTYGKQFLRLSRLIGIGGLQIFD